MSIREIARQARVSPAAVSYALRGIAHKVSPATREKIEKVAEELGYHRDWQSSIVMGKFRASKKAGASGTIALIHPSGCFANAPSDSSLHKSLPAMKERARELNYTIDLIDEDKASASGARLKNILLTRAVRGIIILNGLHHIDGLSFDISGLHAVAIGYSVNQPLSRVCPDQYGNMLHTLERLRALGYKRPALLMYHDLDQRTHYRYTAALLVHYRCIIEDSHPAIFLGPPDALRFQRWLKKEKPDVLIMEEQMYHPEWVGSQIKAMGLSIPRDVGLVSIDIWRRPHMKPLAGIMQNWPELGRRAVEMMVSKIYHGEAVPEAKDTEHIELVSGTWSDGWTIRNKCRE